MRLASSAKIEPPPSLASSAGAEAAFVEPSPRRRGARCNAVLVFLTLATAAPAVSAQGTTTPPQLLVIVTDEITKQPIIGAQVGLRVGRLGGLTDSLGIVRLEGMRVGRDTLIVRFIGYGSLSTVVDLEPGTVTEAMFAMRKEAAELPTVTVRGKQRRSPGPGFEDRQRLGFGHFVTREDIERRAPSQSSDILRQVPGVRLIPIRGGGYNVHMGRSSSNCRIQYYVDNLPLSTEEIVDASLDRRNLLDMQSVGAGSNQARARSRRLNRDIPSFHIDQINPQNIEAIEIYRGASEIPVQYNRSGSLCGVILIWMRTGK